MTPDELQAIRRRQERALQIGWPGERVHLDCLVTHDVPALVAEVERLRAVLERIAESPIKDWPQIDPNYSNVCNECIYKCDDARIALMPPDERKRRGH